VIDIGCGVGHYARITEGVQYLGMDINDRYIEYAKSSHHAEKIAFRAGDVATLVDEGQTFDIALMFDFLHHISDESVARLLRTAGQLSRRHSVNLEPVSEQTNRVGDWFIKNDRGEYMHTTESLMNVFAQAGDKLKIVKCEKLQLGPITTPAILSAPL
jgi:SAM-dependent methyltransferase